MTSCVCFLKKKNTQKKNKQTRIVRGSEYSPASELFARVRKTMTGNNPKLDLVNTDAHKKIGQILSICSQGTERKRNSESIKGQNSVKSLQKNDRQQSQSCQCCCAYKFWSDSVNRSQDIERKRNSDVNQGP